MIPSFSLEQSLFKKGYKIIAGIDEAGRGAWAGPLVVAAVILPKDFALRGWGVKDSKRLSFQARRQSYKLIIKNSVSWNISVIENTIIDQIGLSQANQKAVLESFAGLNVEPDYLLIDEMKAETFKPAAFIINGDQKIASIAAASILAKVTRDEIMKKLHLKFPSYGFSRHKGYGTRLHQALLAKYGVCEIHRKSYKPIKKYL